MRQFSIGDVVRLKSGGPHMTVEETTLLGDHVGCKWFDASGKLTYHTFRPEILIAVPSEGDGER